VLLWWTLLAAGDRTGSQEIAERQARPVNRVCKQPSCVEPSRRFDRWHLVQSPSGELTLKEVVDLGDVSGHAGRS
jgi:hypothetical protein